MERPRRGKVDPLIGLQRGDEGKGKIAYYYVMEHYAVVVRFNGGANAGHEVMEVTLHQFPESVLDTSGEKLGIISNASLLDPILWAEERDELSARGFEVSPDNLKIGENAFVVMPHHKLKDALSESLGGRQGTTLKGMRWAAADQAAHVDGHAILIVRDIKKLAQTAREGLEEYNLMAAQRPGLEAVDVNEELGKWLSGIEDSGIKDYIDDVDEIIQARLRDGQDILPVGGQGAQLDVIRGMVPYTTSSNPGVDGVLRGLGIGPRDVGTVRGVAKLFPTHVGDGPSKSRIRDRKIAEVIIGPRGPGSEHGKTTGRERPPGWLDLPVLRSAVRHNGVNELILTKLDVAERLRLLGMGHMTIVMAYINGQGERLIFAPSHSLKLEECGTEEIEVPLWEGEISKTRKMADLEPAVKALVELVRKEVNREAPPNSRVNIELLSVGPEVDQIITH